VRITTLVIAVILGLAFDSGFGGLFTLRSLGSITPLAIPCIVVFVALFAPPTAALVAAWLIGILVDLSPGQSDLIGGMHLLGPHTLGYPVAVLVILRIRTVVFRRRILTMAILVACCVVAVGAVEALLLVVRGLMPWNPAATSGGMPALARLIATAIYSGLLAVPLGWGLFATIGLWRFQVPSGRKTLWR
jgi:cell shape-determining protein MreD